MHKCVWHRGLIHKLRAAGVTGEVLAWFKDYLSNRNQRVVIPGATSDTVYIQAGVPQGSILRPLLFLLYINDIVEDIGSNIRLFADDTSLYIIVKNPATAALCLNTDLGKISRWAATWLVTFKAAPVAEWLRSLTSVLLIIRSSHRCGFAPRTEHEFICETSHVLLAGVSGGFPPGTPVFAPPTD